MVQGWRVDVQIDYHSIYRSLDLRTGTLLKRHFNLLHDFNNHHTCFPGVVEKHSCDLVVGKALVRAELSTVLAWLILTPTDGLDRCLIVRYYRTRFCVFRHHPPSKCKLFMGPEPGSKIANLTGSDEAFLSGSGVVHLDPIYGQG